MPALADTVLGIARDRATRTTDNGFVRTRYIIDTGTTRYMVVETHPRGRAGRKVACYVETPHEALRQVIGASGVRTTTHRWLTWDAMTMRDFVEEVGA